MIYILFIVLLVLLGSLPTVLIFALIAWLSNHDSPNETPQINPDDIPDYFDDWKYK